MRENTAVPRSVQVVTGACLGAIAIAAVRVDIINNYDYGLGEGGYELATVMVLAAVCVVALPTVAAIYGWSSLLRWMTALCVLMTCWCAVNAYAQKMGHSILSRTSQASVYAGAEKDQAAARATLARITETADTPALEALIAAAKVKAEEAERADTRKMGSASCFKACRAAQTEHMALLTRLSEAKARDAAKRELAAAKTEAKAGPAEASMVATWIATRTKTDATDIARTIALVMTFLGIVVTQGAALLAHTAASLIGSGLGYRRGAPQQPESEQAAAPTTITTEAQAYRWVLDQILQSPGRQLKSSGHELAAASGVAPSTMAKWVKGWKEEGRIGSERSGNRTTFTLPRVKRVA
jgi:hypothetical protein